MSETTLVYEASVFKRTVKYTNFNGETKEVELQFALDPMQLMRVIAGVPTHESKSNNPAKRGELQIADGDQVKFVQDLARKSAGVPSKDGESWLPYENFDQDLAGKAFMTKLVSSDADRREFAEKVCLNPFRAFVAFAVNDPSNKPEEVEQFRKMQAQMERIFALPDPKNESIEERKARLRAELEAVDAEGPAEGTQGMND